METIWGDPLGGAADNPSTPGEDLEELTGDVDQASYIENAANTSSDEKDVHLTGSDLKITTLDEADNESNAPNKLKIENTTSDDEDLCCSRVDLKNTTSDDKYLSCNKAKSNSTTPDETYSSCKEDNLKSTISDEDLSGDEADLKSKTVQVNFKKAETNSDEEDIFKEDKSKTTQVFENITDDNNVDNCENKNITDKCNIDNSEDKNITDENHIDNCEDKNITDEINIGNSEDKNITDEINIDNSEDKNITDKTNIDNSEDKNITDEININNSEDKNITDENNIDNCEDKNITDENNTDNCEDKNITDETNIDNSEDKNITDEININNSEDKNITDENNIDNCEDKNLTDENNTDNCEDKNITDETNIDNSEDKNITDEKNIDNCQNKNITDENNIIDNCEDKNITHGNDIDNSEDKNENYIISVKLTPISENEDDDFIKIVDLSNRMSKVYEVNGSWFVEGEHRSQHDTDELAKYELYQVERMTEEEEDDEDMTTKLDIHIQRLPQGVIINSNVYLWDVQWNTMALIDGELFRCAICQVYCDRLTCEDHVETIAHLRNLEKYKPLKRFDLSIVRKINSDLHCAVCNDLFDIIDFKIHENSKKHEGNLLTAINKVSDLMYDSDIHVAYKNRQFHGRNTSTSDRNTPSSDRNTPSSDRNTPGSGRNTSSSDRNTPSSDRNTPSSDRNTPGSGRNTSSYDRIMSSYDRNVSTPERTLRNDGEYHFDANAINNNNINIYEQSSEEEEFSDKEEEYEEFSEAEEATEEYSYEIEEYNTPSQGISYASMASKPTIKLPKFLKIDLGAKEVRVKFESWHMITKIASNQYYCMVCNTKDQIRFKSRHCISCEHVEKLAKCTIVTAFQEYLIRKVDDKLYHCGHCNYLQYQHQMEDHINGWHPKINRNYSETRNPRKSNKKTKTTEKKDCPKTVIEPKKTESYKSAIINKNLDHEPNMDPLKLDADFNVFGDIPLTPFGCTLRIPVLNFNLIMKRDDDYYCAICDKVCVDPKVHVDELEHIQLMSMTPFVKQFGNNLTRVVRGMYHCSICNKLFSLSEIFDHNICQLHTTPLATAMGMKKSQKPIKTKRVTKLNLDYGHNSANNQATQVLYIKNMPPLNLPSKERLQKENVKPVSSNQFTEQVSAQITSIKPEITQNNPLANSGQNFAPQNCNTASAIVNTQSGQNRQNIKLFTNMLNIRQNTGPNVPQPGPKYQYLTTHHFQPESQYFPKCGPNLPQAGPNRQNLSNAAPNLPNAGQNLPYFEQHLPNPGPNQHQPNETLQNVSNSGRSFLGPQYNAHSIKSIPPMFNSMFPSLPPVNTQSLKNQFIRPPLVYNFTAPRPAVSPFPNAPRSNSPNQSPHIPANTAQKQSEKIQNNQEVERKTIKTYRKDSVSENDNSKGNDDVDKVETDSESEDECKEFDEEEMVFLKLKTTYFKITNMSYNTLVFLDNGIRFCFACSTMVSTSQEKSHVESRKHMDHLAENKFLDKYGVQLFRQMYLIYHCAICNELMTRKEIKLHLEWPVHVEEYDAAHLILNKKNRKELKSGLKEYVVETQKEAIFHNVKEPNYHLRAAYHIVPNLDVKKDGLDSRPARGSTSTVVKKNKMVIQNNVVMKMSFVQWHGITSAKNITKCIICQVELTPDEVFEHVETEYHAVALGKTFEKAYYPALVRKINESSVNCMTCNLELPNSEYMILEHTSGRKHCKNQQTILSDTSHSDSYADCYEDYLNI